MEHQLYNNEQYKETFTKLSNLTVKGETADVFIPLVPDDWDNLSSPKINWYGAAPNGWGSKKIPDVWSFANNLAGTKEFAEGGLLKYKSGSPFWRIQRACASLIKADRTKFVWNNIFKIGGPIDNPSTSLKKAQLSLCLDAFAQENTELCPDLIVLHTGGLADDFFNISDAQKKNFPGDWKKWEVSEDELSAYIVHNGQPYIWLTRRRNRSDVAVANSFLKSYKQVMNECNRTI